MAQVEAYNTGLTEEQLGTAFSRALGDYTDAEIDALLAEKQAAIDALSERITALQSSLYGLAEQIGTDSEVTVDLNDLLTPGRYRVFSTTEAARITNAPFTDRGYELIVKYTSQSNYIMQMCYPALNASSANKFYIRHYRGTGSGALTGWSSWYEYAGTALT